MFGATQILLGDVKRDVALQRTELAGIAAELHKLASGRRRPLRELCVDTLQGLPLEDIKSAVAIADHVNSMSRVTCLKSLHLGKIYMPTHIAQELDSQPPMAKCLLAGAAPPLKQYEDQGLLSPDLVKAVRKAMKTAHSGRS